MSTKSRRLEVSKADLHNDRSEMALCLRFFDADLSVSSPLGATVARVGKHD
jgi:hypothetical protein